MNYSYKIGRIAGINIYVHMTWLFIFVLLAWSLSTDYFPATYKFGVMTSWVLGIAAALLLFASVLLHELSHSIVSKRNRMHVENITLFFFGGVAQVSPDEHGPKTELKISIAGPIMSVAIGIVFYALYTANLGAGLTAIFDYLFKINLILAAFNMIPGYPLDGGRVLRSVLWIYYKDIIKATKIASTAGQIFGFFLIITGFLGALGGGIGLWYILLGAFLVFLAKTGYEQVIVKERLSKIRVSDVMKPARLIDPTQTIAEFIADCEREMCSGIVKTGSKYYGMDLNLAAKVPAPAQDMAKVKDVMVAAKPVSQKDDCFKCLYQMQKQGVRVIPVQDKARLIGQVTEEQVTHMIRLAAIRGMR
ncbi:MAG: site-2 protease family protein [Candidatus Woesearchaeota archaeon]